ncbi:hypothetical protein M231_00094 [Tremella mesenterica]|uniref:Uncharacterized protein n=1 Tax=Tremella mesenterica TaxID=5217 RepID=A0A4Q1BWL4_TREME|nr:hypothetical protein M231_00094 [Tremella mesenterica]
MRSPITALIALCLFALPTLSIPVAAPEAAPAPVPSPAAQPLPAVVEALEARTTTEPKLDGWRETAGGF